MAIWKAFDEYGIKPPYPHQELHMRGDLPQLTYDKLVHEAAGLD
jgi:small-conductance mechanosensitive channel